MKQLKIWLSFITATILTLSLATPSQALVSHPTSPEVVVSNPTFTFTEGVDSKITLDYTTPNLIWSADTGGGFVGNNSIQPYIGWQSIDSIAAAPFGISMGSYRPDDMSKPVFTMQGKAQIGTAGTYRYSMDLLYNHKVNGNWTSDSYPIELTVVVLKSSTPPKPKKSIQAYANLNEGYDLSFAFTGMKVNAPYRFYLDKRTITGMQGLVPYAGKVPFNGELGIQYTLPVDIKNGWHQFEFKTKYFDNKALNYKVWIFVSVGKITIFNKSPNVDNKVYSSCSDLNAKFPYGVIKDSKGYDKLYKNKSAGYRGYVNTSFYNKNAKLDKNKNGVICESE